jgi:hypothetical protein
MVKKLCKTAKRTANFYNEYPTKNVKNGRRTTYQPKISSIERGFAIFIELKTKKKKKKFLLQRNSSKWLNTQ